MNKKNRFISFVRENVIYIVIISIIAIFMGIFTLIRSYEESKIGDVKTGTSQIYTETKGYVLLKETVIDHIDGATIVPLAESEKRVTKNEVVALYKNDEYDNATRKLSEIDQKINEKLQVLPEVYSSDVITIENQIEEVVRNIPSTSSYITMNDYKTTLDELAYNKALTIAGLTPSGTEVKTLIAERDAQKNTIKNMSNNIKAPISGVALYQKDGLENKYKMDRFTQSSVEELIKDYDMQRDVSFGIKIVDNYEAYIIIREDKSKEEYIKEGYSYDIELMDKNQTIKGILIKKISTDLENYCVFKISNNIEYILSSRKMNMKVIWKSISGYVVSKTALKVKDDVCYVTVISYNEYVDVPVKKLIDLDHDTIVSNYTKEEREKLNITNKKTLKLYDRIVKDNNGT